MRIRLLLCAALLGASCLPAQQVQPPKAKYSVQYLPLRVEDQDLRMAYRDVPPASAANGKTVLLFHGKNFSGFYWESTVEFLASQGYRVIAPDQFGFGQSSRPDIHYSFHQMAENTKALLDHLGVKQVNVIGHSMGGMLAVRFTLMYPETVETMVLENPIGLEDYRKLVPYISPAEEYATELAQTYQKMLDYQKTYYPEPNAWRPEYEAFVQDQAQVIGTAEWPRDAWSAALTYEMIYEQPIVYELGDIKRPSLVIIGQDDRTVVGKGHLPPELKSIAGQLPQLGRKTRDAIPGAKLVEVQDCGHIPHVQRPDQFRKAITEFFSSH